MKYPIIALICIILGTLSFMFTDQGPGNEAPLVDPVEPSTVAEMPAKRVARGPVSGRKEVAVATVAASPPIVWAEVQPVILRDVQALWPETVSFSRGGGGPMRRQRFIPQMRVIPSVQMTRGDLAAVESKVPFVLEFEQKTVLKDIAGRYGLVGYYEVATKRVYLRRLDTKEFEAVSAVKS